jgi:hypothetical protein
MESTCGYYGALKAPGHEKILFALYGSNKHTALANNIHQPNLKLLSWVSANTGATKPSRRQLDSSSKVHGSFPR